MGTAAEQDQVGEARALSMLFMDVVHTLRMRFEGAAAAFDLSPQQARALLAIRGEGAPMRGLATALQCDASNITGIADRLEARNLIAREAAPADRRVKLLVLTPEGQRLREALTARIVADNPVMTVLEADERTVLRDLLGRLIAPEVTAPQRGGC